MLSLKNLSVFTAENDRKKRLLHDVSLQFPTGSVTAVMGPNGSGKSTLARAIAGDKFLTLSDRSVIELDGENITSFSADKRAQKGVFLSFQTPPEISGVSVRDLMRIACRGKQADALTVKKNLEKLADKLQIPDKLLDRSLNEGFSGGERKKMEVLQMAMLDPKFVILDEIDTGVDVDALKIIGEFIRKFAEDGRKTLLLITHNNRIFDYLKPQQTVILKNGRVAITGDGTLAEQIEKTGFANL